MYFGFVVTLILRTTRLLNMSAYAHEATFARSLRPFCNRRAEKSIKY